MEDISARLIRVIEATGPVGMEGIGGSNATVTNDGGQLVTTWTVTFTTPGNGEVKE
jgi:hypothetical protein